MGRTSIINKPTAGGYSDGVKKALEDHSIEKLKYQDGIKIKEIDFISILTLINELESENKEYEK